MLEDYADLGSRDVFRMLHLFERLNKGEILSKEKLAREYDVSEKTIQRDIADLRYYLNQVHFKMDKAITYNKKEKGYVLGEKVWQYQTNQQILAVVKILLASRAFNKQEMNTLLSNMIDSATPEERKYIKIIVQNEQYHYQTLHHEKPLIDLIWKLSEFIYRQEIIQFDYTRQDEKIVSRKAVPIAILFSEYYFYVIAKYPNSQKNYPVILRLDRINNIISTGEKCYTPYSNRFEEGELRKRIQFMYGGEKITVKFKFWGSSLQAVLDRLPTAEVLGQDENNKYLVQAEVFGDGIKMWLFSQMDKVEVLEPESLRNEMTSISRSLSEIYNK